MSNLNPAIDGGAKNSKFFLHPASINHHTGDAHRMSRYNDAILPFYNP
jgi:hypothetical protein